VQAIREGKVAKFRPITLIIETREEAEIIWHSLNLPDGVITSYAGQEFDSGQQFKVWKALDNVYNPEEE